MVFGIDGRNNDSYSISIAKNATTSIRLLAFPPATPRNGDIWLGVDGHIYCYTNGGQKDLTNI